MKNKALFKNLFSLCAAITVFQASLFSLDYTDIHTNLADTFYDLAGENEGTTSFRSLLIPTGGRTESLGGAYTGLSDDLSYLDYNPAASSINTETELGFYHNSWIADSAMETIACTDRFGNFGIGGKISCFYVPFTEYDSFGTKLKGGVYSETTGVLNFSYNIIAGYTFKGIAIGGNLKAAWRQIPDYCDKNTGNIISGSGMEQSALAVMGDAGIMLQFNAAKFYTSLDPNIRFGISAANLGAAFTGFQSESGVKSDDPLPAVFGAGISYKPLAPLTFTLDYRQAFNLSDLSEYQTFTVGTGFEAAFTDFFSILGGFQLKGGNPRISLGSEFEFYKFRMNINYTLDLTSSLNPVNHISLSGKIKLGDKGRKEKRNKAIILYNEGIRLFSAHDFDGAIEKWEEVLSIDKFFDPARTGIKNARAYKAMLEKYNI